jgi:branched-chain amino acid aminotransferase
MPTTEHASTTSSQAYEVDPRNDCIYIYVNGDFFPRHLASVSVFDSGFVAGDGVWEGLRLVNGRLIAIDEHMERLFSGAKSINLDIGLSAREVEDLIWTTLTKNQMFDGVHIRLMVTRGMKSTPNQDPRFVLGKPSIVIVAEYKKIPSPAESKPISLFTSSFRCSSPDVFDLRLNSHSRLNLIQALLQAIAVGADEALMLDPHGFVASCNSTNFFIVHHGELWTSSGRYNFNGITQRTVQRLAREAGIPVRITDFTLAETYSADEAFVTGTLGGIIPVSRVDGRAIGAGGLGQFTETLAHLYHSYLHGKSVINEKTSAVSTNLLAKIRHDSGDFG